MNVELEILTPLHIGSGESLFRLEYVFTTIKNKDDVVGYNLKILDLGELIGFLFDKTPKEKHDTLKDEILKYIGTHFDNTRFTGKVQGLIKVLVSKGLLPKEFLEPKFQVELFNKCSLNSLRVNSLPSDLKTQIDLYILDGNKEPYIPGSSIKGALMTALQYHLLKKKGFSDNELAKLVIDSNNKKKRDLARNAIRALRDKKKRLDAILKDELRDLSRNIIVRDFYFKSKPVSFDVLRLNRINTLTNKKEMDLSAALFVSSGNVASGEIILKDEFKKKINESEFLNIVNEFNKQALKLSKFELNVLDDDSTLMQLGKYGGYFTKTLGALWFDEKIIFPKTRTYIEYKGKPVQPGWVKMKKVTQ